MLFSDAGKVVRFNEKVRDSETGEIKLDPETGEQRWALKPIGRTGTGVLIDVVSFGICPAVILLSYGNYHPAFLPGAFIIVAACVLRLSYFNVYGLDGKSSYQGLASDNNAIILVFVFLLESVISTTAFTVVLYITILGLAALNVAPIKTPKLSGRWYYVLALYTLVITLAYSWLLI